MQQTSSNFPIKQEAFLNSASNFNLNFCAVNKNFKWFSLNYFQSPTHSFVLVQIKIHYNWIKQLKLYAA